MPQPKKAEWEMEFDQRFMATLVWLETNLEDDEVPSDLDMNHIGETLKSFIRSTLEAERARIVGVLEGMKSDCKTYHNEIVDTPEKIKVFNMVLDAAIKSIEE